MNGRGRRAPDTDVAGSPACTNVAEALATLAQLLSFVYVARRAPGAVLLTESAREALAGEYADLDVGPVIRYSACGFPPGCAAFVQSSTDSAGNRDG
jgi:hypothetical protein